MKLDLEFNNEPLGDLFPLSFLRPDPPFKAPEQTAGSSAIQRRGVDRSLDVDANGRHIFRRGDTDVDEEEEDDDDDGEASSSEAVIANLEAMDVSFRFLLYLNKLHSGLGHSLH